MDHSRVLTTAIVSCRVICASPSSDVVLIPRKESFRHACYNIPNDIFIALKKSHVALQE